MMYCYQSPFHIDAISCRYPPRIVRRFKASELQLKIIDIVCVHFGVTTFELYGDNRKREVVDARHMSMRLIKDFVIPISVVKIGQQFKRDHSTVLAAFKKVEDMKVTNRDFNKTLQDLTDKVSSYIHRNTPIN